MGVSTTSQEESASSLREGGPKQGCTPKECGHNQHRAKSGHAGPRKGQVKQVAIALIAMFNMGDRAFNSEAGYAKFPRPGPSTAGRRAVA